MPEVDIFIHLYVALSVFIEILRHTASDLAKLINIKNVLFYIFIPLFRDYLSVRFGSNKHGSGGVTSGISEIIMVGNLKDWCKLATGYFFHSAFTICASVDRHLLRPSIYFIFNAYLLV